MASADEVLEACPDGIVVVSPEGEVVRMNAAAESLVGDLVGRRLAGAAPAFAAIAGRAEHGEAWGTVPTPKGPVEVRAAPTGDGGRVLAMVAPGRFAGLGADEGELARVTALAAGLAHEIKNPLAGLKGAADLLARDAAAGPLADYARVIATEAARVDDLVRGLLDLARPRAPRLSPVDLHALVDEVLVLARPTLGERVRVERRFDPSLPEIPGDRAQLVEVLQNLVLNAAEAMGQRGGTLTVSTGAALGLSSGSAGRPRRTMMRLEVSDTGPGFDADVLARPFTPFQTTKTAGTGLGLALCRRLVEAHGGLLEVANTEEGGARVTVLLPVR